MKPLVTIGMCVRNCEKTIRAAVRSIARQDFPHEQMEVIFVVGKSNDNTLPIVEDFASGKDIRSRVFQEEAKGLGAARNIIVSNAEGEYIVWVDGDIILSRDHVSKQVDFMARNEKVGIAKGTVKLPSNANLVLTLEIIPYMIGLTQKREWSSSKNLPGTGAATYRVDALRQIRGFDEKIRGVGEDQDAAYRVMKAGWLICRTDATFYETHQGMATLGHLWHMYFWRGVTSYALYKQNKHHFVPLRMTPPAGFISGLLCSVVSYRVIRRKTVFLLPFHYAFKMTAWFSGFCLSRVNDRS